MLDLSNKSVTMMSVDQEDKALQRCNLSARSMPGDGRGHGDYLMLLSPYPSLGFKAKNLLAWGEAPSKAKITKYGRPVGHMSISSTRRAFFTSTLIGNAEFLPQIILLSLLNHAVLINFRCCGIPISNEYLRLRAP